MNSVIFITPLTILFSAIGLTFLFRMYIENLLSGFIVRRAGGIKRDTRVKILTFPVVIKGDVVRVGPVRTTLVEVGDGEHLPSIRTKRLIKVPNTMLVSNPIVIYGDTIVDEVIAEIPVDTARVDGAVQAMREAIAAHGHAPMEVGIFQKGDRLVVHGVFEVQTSSTADERSKILRRFLTCSPKVESTPATSGSNGSGVRAPG